MDGNRLTGNQPPQPLPSGEAAPAPGDPSGSGLFSPGGIAQRIQAAVHGAAASLPRAVRARAAHLWNATSVTRLTEAMALWIRGVELEEEQFAELFFHRAAGDPGVSLLHDAVKNVSLATDHKELSGGAEKIAAALQVIGIERWPGFLAEVSGNARDLTTRVAPDDSGLTGKPEQLPMPGQAGAGVRPRLWPLPPPNVTPPVRNPARLAAGNASRASEVSTGGQSLWDEHGGEWRYYPQNTWNTANWDYNEHKAANSPWRNVPGKWGAS